MGVVGAQRGVKANRRQRGISLKHRREAFFTHFAANCSVRAAAAAAEIPITTLNLWRRTDPDFAAQWALAMEAGYAMVEARLLEQVLTGGTGAHTTVLDGIEGTPVAPLNIELGLKLLSYRRPGKPEQVRGSRPPATPVTRETMMAELLKRLDQVEARNRRTAARLAANGESARLAAKGESARLAAKGDSARLAAKGGGEQTNEHCRGEA